MNMKLNTDKYEKRIFDLLVLMLSFLSVNKYFHRCNVYVSLKIRAGNKHSKELKINTDGRYCQPK